MFTGDCACPIGSRELGIMVFIIGSTFVHIASFALRMELAISFVSKEEFLFCFYDAAIGAFHARHDNSLWVSSLVY